MRSDRPFAAVAACKLRVCAFDARASFLALARAWSARARNLHAAAAANGRFERIFVAFENATHRCV
eukprot:6754713-Lingulodinium_polyedra.AAC.1